MYLPSCHETWRQNRLQWCSCGLWFPHVTYQAQGDILIHSRSWNTVIKLSNFLQSLLSSNVTFAGCMHLINYLEEIFNKCNSSPSRKNRSIVGLLQKLIIISLGFCYIFQIIFSLFNYYKNLQSSLSPLIFFLHFYPRAQASRVK